MLYSRLQLPVTGILGPSYAKAVAAAGPVAAAVRAPALSAGMAVS